MNVVNLIGTLSPLDCIVKERTFTESSFHRGIRWKLGETSVNLFFHRKILKNC